MRSSRLPCGRGRLRSVHPQVNDPVRGVGDNLLHVVSGQVAPPGTPHELGIPRRPVADRLVKVTERDVPLVPPGIVAVGVARLESQASHQHGVARIPVHVRELVVSVGIRHDNLEGEPADHCHHLSVQPLVHGRHYMKSATSRDISILVMTTPPVRCCARSVFRASSMTSRESKT